VKADSNSAGNRSNLPLRELTVFFQVTRACGMLGKLKNRLIGLDSR
jgi:phage tail tube protein FII